MSRRSIVRAAIFSVLAGCSAGNHLQSSLQLKGTEPGSDESFIGVRVLKVSGSGEINWSVQLPNACATCRLHDNEYTSGQNPKEFYFHFLAPGSGKSVDGVYVKVDPTKVRGVLVGHSRVPFSRTADGITFDAPQNGPKLSQLGNRTLPADGAGDVTEQYTYLEIPGVETRIEHADEQRRKGYYATANWPALEHQAAINLEFGAREAIVSLGLDRTVRERGLGTILLMGFDTNTPTLTPNSVHEDYPPHWHMHVSWAHDPLIREVGHLFIGPDGLLTSNTVSDGTKKPELKEFNRGETHVTRINDVDGGEVLYSHTITADGSFELSTPSGMCRLSPVSGGFQSGVEVACDNGVATERIRAEDDILAGRLSVFRNDELMEEHTYDPDNGTLKRSELVYADRH